MVQKGPPKGTVNNPLGKNQWNTAGGKIGNAAGKAAGTISGAVRGAKTMVRGLPGTKGGGALGRARRSKLSGVQTAKLVTGAAVKGALGGARMGAKKTTLAKKYEMKGKRIGTSVGNAVNKTKNKIKNNKLVSKGRAKLGNLRDKAVTKYRAIKTKYKLSKENAYRKRVGATSPARRFANNKSGRYTTKRPSTYGSAGAKMMAGVNAGIPRSNKKSSSPSRRFSKNARYSASSGPSKRFKNKSKIASLPEVTVAAKRKRRVMITV